MLAKKATETDTVSQLKPTADPKVEKEKPNGARLGVNVDVVLGVLVAALLSWVGIQTHLSALQMREVATTLTIFMPYQTAELKRQAAELEGLEERLREVENHHVVQDNGRTEQY